MTDELLPFDDTDLLTRVQETTQRFKHSYARSLQLCYDCIFQAAKRGHSVASVRVEVEGIQQVVDFFTNHGFGTEILGNGGFFDGCVIFQIKWPALPK